MSKHLKKSTSELRIIAGKFRSRKITFTEEEGLRPTHNRIRETLFNWLNDVIENTVCFDVFAGSGALGFEALSRGAKYVTFMDISKNIVATLKENAEKLAVINADFMNSDFMLENAVKNKKFDIVFCDPPFKKNILLITCELLESRELLNPLAFIYLEFEKNSVDVSLLPKNWVIKKHKSTQTIEYLLCQKSA
ncbi:MAG: 16S rRNA (guanine(966)-N(2))-methyltransferase RsmD [Gammaproteobacteria bacterium RIFCSPHIGHO2_12_FULL_40_19]|nr:MAG: 16S rRNA (guanine(966)-N(2))-methyltransferase RsmD [Gammaproteobacteria bacterium RIFCSPHIGHO2_12_FULL_40_19]